MTVSILIIDKKGEVKSLGWKNYDEEKIYTKAGFKNSENFELRTTYKCKIEKEEYNIDVYGKTVGRANTENKYEFPPPIDNLLMFGSCVLISRDENRNAKDISVGEWDKIYDKLYGGFEDIGEEDSVEEEEEEEDIPKTKSGYAKDGFVVEDDDDYLECSSELSEEEYI
jgi:hypothetical protein